MLLFHRFHVLLPDVAGTGMDNPLVYGLVSGSTGSISQIQLLASSNSVHILKGRP